MTALLALGGATVAALLLYEAHRAHQERRWRQHHEQRLAAMQERRCQADGHPHTGRVQHLGRR